MTDQSVYNKGEEMKKKTQDQLVKIICQLDKDGKEFNAGRARKAIKYVFAAVELANAEAEVIAQLATTLKKV